MAERRLIAFAEQVQQRRALREVVVRVGALPPRAWSAPRSRRYSPQAAGATLRVERVGGCGEPLLGFRQASGRVRASAAISVACSASNGGAPACENLVGERRPLRRALRAASPDARPAREPTIRTTGSSGGRTRRRRRWPAGGSRWRAS